MLDTSRACCKVEHGTVQGEIGSIESRHYSPGSGTPRGRLKVKTMIPAFMNYAFRSKTEESPGDCLPPEKKTRTNPATKKVLGT